MESSTIAFEDYLNVRHGQQCPPVEKYFRWKWSVRHFSTAMQSRDLKEPEDGIHRLWTVNRVFTEFSGRYCSALDPGTQSDV